MKVNMNSTDRVARIIISAILAVLYFTNTITGTLGMALLAVAIIFTLTSFIGFCPIYKMLGMSSKKSPKNI